MTKTQLVAHLAELPAERIVDLQLVFSLAQRGNFVLGQSKLSEWADLLAEAIELKKHQYTDFDEVDQNPIGI